MVLDGVRDTSGIWPFIFLKGCESVSWRIAKAKQKGSRNQGLTTLVGKCSKQGFGEKIWVREIRVGIENATKRPHEAKASRPWLGSATSTDLGRKPGSEKSGQIEKCYEKTTLGPPAEIGA